MAGRDEEEVVLNKQTANDSYKKNNHHSNKAFKHHSHQDVLVKTLIIIKIIHVSNSFDMMCHYFWSKRFVECVMKELQVNEIWLILFCFIP